jgi:hypothetical protein
LVPKGWLQPLLVVLRDLVLRAEGEQFSLAADLAALVALEAGGRAGRAVVDLGEGSPRAGSFAEAAVEGVPEADGWAARL